MIRCNHCGAVFEDDELLVVHDDPSPAGICLPAGSYAYAYCPICGDDDIEEDFSLFNEIDVEEGRNQYEAVISFMCSDTCMLLYVDGKGNLQMGWPTEDFYSRNPQMGCKYLPESFCLAEELNVEEDVDSSQAFISYKGKTMEYYVDNDGDVCFKWQRKMAKRRVSA